MSVNRISQSHANEAEAVHNVNSQKAQNTATKAHAVDVQKAQAQTQAQTRAPAQTQPKATADNNAGQEQARRQNTGNDTSGTRVNVFA